MLLMSLQSPHRGGIEGCGAASPRSGVWTTAFFGIIVHNGTSVQSGYHYSFAALGERQLVGEIRRQDSDPI